MIQPECSICNENPARNEAAVTFPESEKVVTLQMCDVCYLEFEADETVHVSW